MKSEFQITAQIINQALADVCKKGGYCTYLDGESLLKKYQNNVTAEHFATAVLFAEGLNTKYSNGRGLIEKVFSECVERAKRDYNKNNPLLP